MVMRLQYAVLLHREESIVGDDLKMVQLAIRENQLSHCMPVIQSRRNC